MGRSSFDLFARIIKWSKRSPPNKLLNKPNCSYNVIQRVGLAFLCLSHPLSSSAQINWGHQDNTPRIVFFLELNPNEKQLKWTRETRDGTEIAGSSMEKQYIWSSDSDLRDEDKQKVAKFHLLNGAGKRFHLPFPIMCWFCTTGTWRCTKWAHVSMSRVGGPFMETFQEKVMEPIGGVCVLVGSETSECIWLGKYLLKMNLAHWALWN